MFSFWSIDLCSIEAYQQLADTKGKYGSVACSIESRHALLRKWIRLRETSCQKNPRMRLLHIYHQQHPQQLKATTTPIQDKMVFHHFAGSTATIWMQINTGVKEMHSPDWTLIRCICSSLGLGNLFMFDFQQQMQSHSTSHVTFLILSSSWSPIKLC